MQATAHHHFTGFPVPGDLSSRILWPARQADALARRAPYSFRKLAALLVLIVPVLVLLLAFRLVVKIYVAVGRWYIYRKLAAVDVAAQLRRPDGYRQLRLSIDSMRNRLTQQRDRLLDDDRPTVLLRGVQRDVVRFLNDILARIDQLDRQVSQRVDTAPEGQAFRHIPEQELWRQRRGKNAYLA